jgi:hypothetical protein
MTVTIETSRSKETNAQDVERFKETVKKLEDSSPKKDIPLSKKCIVTLSRKPWQDSNVSQYLVLLGRWILKEHFVILTLE